MTINQYEFRKEVRELAKDIFSEYLEYEGKDSSPHLSDLQDLANETVDGHSWVIYTGKAIDLCSNVDTTDGEEWIEDIGGFRMNNGFGGICSQLAYATLYTALCEELRELCDEYEPEQSDDYEEEDWGDDDESSTATEDGPSHE